MSANPSKMFKEIASYLDKYGITITDRELGSRHWKVKITDGAKRAMIVISVSPSDHRAYMNIAQSARQAIREAP